MFTIKGTVEIAGEYQPDEYESTGVHEDLELNITIDIPDLDIKQMEIRLSPITYTKLWYKILEKCRNRDQCARDERAIDDYEAKKMPN